MENVFTKGDLGKEGESGLLDEGLPQVLKCQMEKQLIQVQRK